MDAASEPGLDVYVPLPGGGDAGGGRSGGGDLRCLPLEHCRVIYRNKAHYGPVYGGGTATRSSGNEAVAGVGESGYRGDAVGRSGGGGEN